MRILSLIQLFVLIFLVASTVLVGSVALLLYIFIFQTKDQPTGFPEPDVEQEIKKKLLKEWELTSTESSHADEVYRCGWVYVTPEYSERPAIDLMTLQKMKGRSKSRTNGVYFLVLKHNSLFMYECEEQSFCAHVAVLDGCKVDLFPHTLLLDEIYQKIYPIRIVAPSGGSNLYEGRPSLYLYAANASEKEDWFFALRQVINPPSEAKHKSERVAETIFMERLGRYVKGPQVDAHSQWLNAIGGRIFYNLFRSADLERFFRIKFERKTSSTPRPFFLGELRLQSVYPGQSLPMLSKGQLHGVGQDGEVTVSADVFYPGGFKLAISTEIRCEIPRLKPLIVPVVMSVQVRRLGGRVLIRVKPPPSDRIWFGFYSQPLLDIDVEPIVSSTAVTWSIIKTGILRHLNDSLAEHVVLPNMDDLTIPPLVVGEAFGGERPFVMDFMPPSIIDEAKKLDLTAHGISTMPTAQAQQPRRETMNEGLLERSLLSGSHSLTDLHDADLAMEPVSSVVKRSSGRSSSSVRGTAGLLDGARKSDFLARERTRTSTSPPDPSHMSSPTPSDSNSLNLSTKEMIFSLRRSFSSFFRNRPLDPTDSPLSTTHAATANCSDDSSKKHPE